MNKFLKRVKELKAKGFATSEEKEEVKALYKELEAEDQEVVSDESDEVNALPEEDPKEAEETEKIVKGVKTLVKETTDEAVSDMKKELESFMKSQKEAKEKKVGIYADEAKEKRARMNTYLREFIPAVLSQKELTTDATGSPYAGYIVDDELSAEIRHLQTEYGVARREMSNAQVTKDSIKANNLATDISVGWVDEGSAITSGQVVLGQESLELKKLAVIVAMTRELLEEQEIDLFQFIATRVAEAFAEKEDEAFFNGDGTSTYGSFTGLLNATDVNETTMTGSTFASLDADDLLDLQNDTPQGALRGGKYYMHRSIMNLVRRLKDTNNMPIFQALSESGPATIWGKPVVEVEVMPTTADTAADTSFVLFGDLRQACIFGFRGGISALRSDSAVVRNVADSDDINLFTTDREAIRWTEKVGYIRIIPTAVTKLTTATASA